MGAEQDRLRRAMAKISQDADPETAKHLNEYLGYYLGEGIGVSYTQVNRYLENLSATDKTSRSEKRGRPKGSTSSKRTKRTPENADFIEANHHRYGGTMTSAEIMRERVYQSLINPLADPDDLADAITCEEPMLERVGGAHIDGDGCAEE